MWLLDFTIDFVVDKKMMVTGDEMGGLLVLGKIVTEELFLFVQYIT